MSALFTVESSRTPPACFAVSSLRRNPLNIDAFPKAVERLARTLQPRAFGGACCGLRRTDAEGKKRMEARFQQKVGIESAPLQDEIILFHSPSNKFCVLNRTSSFIGSQRKEPVTSEEIAHRLEGAFSEVDPNQALADIDAALTEMLSLGLIVNVNGSSESHEVNR